MKTIQLSIRILISWIAIFPITIILNIEDYNLSNSIFSIIIFFANNYILFKAKELKEKEYIPSIILAFIFSFSLYIGKYVEETYSIPTLNFKNLLYFISLFFIILSFLYLFLNKLSYLYNILYKYKILYNFINILFKKPLILFFFFLICWMPAFFSSAPGVFSYDAPHQYWQFDTGNIGNNQPIFSSFVLYSLINLGKFLFGNYNAGLAFFIILQMLFASFTNTLVCHYMYKYKVPHLLILLSIIYYAFHPIHHLFIINATKDVLFSYFFMHLVLLLIDMAYNTEDFISKKRKPLWYCVCILLCTLYRNNGIYVILLLVPFLIILIKRKKIVIMTILCIAFYFSITNIIYPALNYSSSSFVEMLAIPVQQMANAYVNDYSSLSEKQINNMFLYLPDGTVEKYKELYHPRNSDTIRPSINAENIKNDPLNFFKTYVSIGFSCPKAYINGFLNNTLAYWYPDADMPDVNAAPQKYIEYENSNYQTISLMTKRFNWFPKISSFYREIGEQGSFKSIPVLSMIFSMGFIFWIYAFILVYALYKKQYKMLLALLALIFLWLTSIAGPVALLRYVYPLFLCLPLIINIWLYNTFNKDIASHSVNGKYSVPRKS